MTNDETDPRYKTADGSPITHGKPLFNYYDGYVVLVKIDGTHADPDSEFHQSWDGWYYTKRENGETGPILNGERMCSLEHARKMGWLKDTGATPDVWAALRERLALG